MAPATCVGMDLGARLDFVDGCWSRAAGAPAPRRRHRREQERSAQIPWRAQLADSGDEAVP
jgi:1,6-anhydro-N-acetylmuramate kinase